MKESKRLYALTRILYEVGSYSDAKSIGKKCLKLYTNIGNLKGMSNSLNLISTIHKDQGEYNEAIYFNKKRLNLRSALL